VLAAIDAGCEFIKNREVVSIQALEPKRDRSPAALAEFRPQRPALDSNAGLRSRQHLPGHFLGSPFEFSAAYGAKERAAVDQHDCPGLARRGPPRLRNRHPHDRRLLAQTAAQRLDPVVHFDTASMARSSASGVAGASSTGQTPAGPQLATASRSA